MKLLIPWKRGRGPSDDLAQIVCREHVVLYRSAMRFERVSRVAGRSMNTLQACNLP